jgi:hypothetical protein
MIVIMNTSKLLRWKIAASLVCMYLLIAASAASGQTITVLGSNPPVPGPNDQYQTNMPSGANQPPGLNYYVDNGNSPGQIFTTGSNPTGYTLTSLALYDADGTGGGFGDESFTLNIYSLSGGIATVYASYVSQSISLPDFQWFQWTNLGAFLQPNTQYAYAMHRNGSGWMNLGNVPGDLYADPAGEVVSIPLGGGTMIFSTSTGNDASFDVGLAPITQVSVSKPVFSPYRQNVLIGSIVTASAQVAGPTPYYYQWITDGGSGGSLTNIPGATGSNLVIDTTGFAVGNYQYALFVSNNNSSVTSQVATLSVVQLVGIPGVIGIKFGFAAAAGYATSDDLAPADQAGVVAVMNWNNLLSSNSPSLSENINTTWNIAQDSAGNALSGVTLTPAGINDGWYNGFSDCANARLLDSFWKFNAGNGQQDAAGKSYSTFTIANLPRTMYDVYVYIDNNNGNYWGNVQANSVLAIGSNIDSDGFNGADSDPCGLATPLHTAAGYGNPANYVKMPFVATTAGGVITVTVLMNGGGDWGVPGIELAPSPDIVLTQDILPTYAETVVGDQVAFTAGLNNSPALNLQWQKISGGLTNEVSAGVVNVTNSGVITSTLTLNNVQLADSASYRLKAINATNSFDVSYTAAAPLVVGNSPTAVNNVIVNYADKTGPNVPNAWAIDTNSDLIFGFPTDGSGNPGTAAAGVGNFGLDGANPDPTVLANTVNVGDNLPADFVFCGPGGGAGQSMTYTLANSGYGFDVTNITVYGGWINGNRIEQLYKISYSNPSAPGTNIPLVTADYKANDPSGAPAATRTTLVPANGVLMHNVYAVEINWNFGNPQNGYCGYSAITFGGTPSSQLYPLPPIVTQDITPLRAEDVVGSQLILTAAFSGATSYQWQKNGTNIDGAAATTLTLNNLQLADAGAYSLVASNAGGTFATRACSVIVDPAPAPVNNIVTAYASQSTDDTIFSPTWDASALSSSLIYGTLPGSSQGDFTGAGVGATAGGLPALTDGSFGANDFRISQNDLYVATAGNNSSAGNIAIYTLTGSTNGYDITNIVSVGSWNDGGRDQQAYTVSYATVADPNTFVPLAIVNVNPVNPAGISFDRATITPASGPLASNVAMLEFNFVTPPGENGWSGYSEIAVFGTPSAPKAPIIGTLLVSGCNLILTGTGGVANGSYTWLSTTNLSAPINWTTNATGTFDGTGAFSNAIPISTTIPARFFRLRVP